MRRVPLAPILVVALAGLLLAGCGRDRIAVPDPRRPEVDTRTRTVALPAAGLRFSLPVSWPLTSGRAPMVATSTSGSATIAVWRYPRSETLPAGPQELREARERLVEAARIRDRTFRLDRARTIEVDGSPAVQIIGDQTVAGRARRVRSTHVFTENAEIVVDSYAAPGDFALADRVAFRRLVRSLRVDAPRA